MVMFEDLKKSSEQLRDKLFETAKLLGEIKNSL